MSMKCNSDIFIYGLIDPRTSELRYVGQTSRGLCRPREHWTHPQSLKDSSYVHKWCRSLLAIGIEPGVVIIESWDGQGDPKNWLDSREIFWIAKKRAEGCRLTNLTAGGGGTLNPSPELRKRLSESHKGKTPAIKGKKFSEESRRKLSESHLGKKASLETRAKMSRSQMGKISSDEKKRKISESQKLRWKKLKVEN